MNETIEREIESEIVDPCPTVKIQNVGPIESLVLPIPEDGGVIVLKGSNGSGKSKALEATQALIRGNGSLSVRDRQLSGVVEGFGAKITVGRSTRRTGELECLSLEGKLDIASLVDPGMKDAAAADARRIKSLVSLTGVKADPAMFYDLAGGTEVFQSVVAKSSVETDDLVDMAAKVKRDFETAARKCEDDAAKCAGRAQGLMSGIEGIDLGRESDAEVLQAVLEGAIGHNSSLKKQAESFRQSSEAKQRARTALAKATAEYTGPTYDEATDAYHNAETLTAGMEAKVFEILRLLDEATKEMEAARVELRHADAIRFSALQHENAMESWQAEIEKQFDITDVSLAELAASESAITGARVAIEQGAKVRDAITSKHKATLNADEATAENREAIRLREAAKSVDEVLSKAVASDVLRVEAGRLVLETPERGVTFFSELSHGQRWKIAIDLAAERVGIGGLIVIPQEAFESLDPTNRQLIADHAKLRRVVIVTAESTLGPLRAEVYGGEV